MLIRYDKEVNALSIVFCETTVTTRGLGEGVAAEFDAEGKLAGLEVLDAAKRMGSLTPLESVKHRGNWQIIGMSRGLASFAPEYVAVLDRAQRAAMCGCFLKLRK